MSSLEYSHKARQVKPKNSKKQERDLYLRAVCEDLSRRARTQYELEYRFHPVRRWRFDAAFPDRKIAIEIDGGVFLPSGGRHNRGAGFRGDCEKINEAALLGWRIFRFLPEQLKSGHVGSILERALLGEVAA